jgi:hypothetical protein
MKMMETKLKERTRMGYKEETEDKILREFL